jgi:transposase
MERLIPSMKDQGVMFAEHYLDDRLPATHEVYAFDALLNEIDISAIVQSYSSEGGKVYSPRDMLAVLLYAYSKGITSSYRIAGEVRANIAFIYLAGGHIISRRAICEFRKRNATLLSPIFSSTVQKADKVGLLRDDKIFAIDGTKIAADASKSKTMTKAEAEERRARIEKSIERFFKELDENDAKEEEIEEDEQKRHEERMRKIRELKNSNGKKPAKDARKVERLIQEKNAIDKALESRPALKDDERINITEPESRLMKCGNGEYLQGFNAQIVTSNQIVCAVDLICDENDQACLVPMVEKLEKELPQIGTYKLLTDAGYNKGENLAWLAAREHIDAYVSMNDRKEDAKSELEKAIGRTAFTYDETADNFICPTGKVLDFQRTRISHGTTYAVYRGKLSDCQRCDGRHACLSTAADKKAGAKIIEDNGTLRFRSAMKEKMAEPSAKAIYANRAIEPEPVWGQWKKNLGFRRFRMRTKISMRGELTLMAIMHNIKKLLSHQIIHEAAVT